MIIKTNSLAFIVIFWIVMVSTNLVRISLQAVIAKNILVSNSVLKRCANSTLIVNQWKKILWVHVSAKIRRLNIPRVCFLCINTIFLQDFGSW